MNSQLQKDDIQLMFRAILELKTMEECERFFEDVCTIHELESMAQRMDVARLLRQGVTYQDICERTGASTATISRVGRSLKYGADGYSIVFGRMNLEDENGQDE